MKKNTLELCVAGLVGMIIALVLGSSSPNMGFGSSRNLFAEGVTNSTTTVASASSTTILAKNLQRQYASICNGSTTGDVFLLFNASTTSGVSTNKGYRLVSEECYEIDSTNLYMGRVMGRHELGGSIVIYTLEK